MKPAASNRRPCVALVYPQLDFYRVPFLEQLRQQLDRRDVDLLVIYGAPREDDLQRGAVAELSWGHKVRQRQLKVGSKRLEWQSCLALVRDADLVVVVQQSRQLVNLVLMALQSLGRTRVAFWGHGRNLSASSASPIAEWMKRWATRRPHWFFAYNDLSQEIVEGIGYPSARITNFQNAIDTTGLSRALEAMDPSTVAETRRALGLRGDNVAIYCGRLDAGKRIPFLLEAANAVRDEIPDFELLILGGGADAPLVEAAAKRHPWLHHLGPIVGDTRVPYFALSKVSLLPGRVGLAVLDSFALKTPMVTSASGEHSVEIAYLEHDVNGLIIEDHGVPENYARELAGLLRDPEKLERLRAGCEQAATRYTTETMVGRCVEGIEKALAAPALH